MKTSMQELIAEATTLTQNGARWCSNILTELCGNYNGKLSESARQHLRDAIHSLAEMDRCIRFPASEAWAAEHGDGRPTPVRIPPPKWHTKPPYVRSAEWALFIVTDGWREHEVIDETGLSEDEGKSLWVTIQDVRERVLRIKKGTRS
jgi:hypothetical protein